MNFLWPYPLFCSIYETPHKWFKIVLAEKSVEILATRYGNEKIKLPSIHSKSTFKDDGEVLVIVISITNSYIWGQGNSWGREKCFPTCFHCKHVIWKRSYNMNDKVFWHYHFISKLGYFVSAKHIIKSFGYRGESEYFMEEINSKKLIYIKPQLTTSHKEPNLTNEI